MKIFAVDCETTGINFKSTDLSQNYQAISWGIVASDTKDFKPIEELYVEIQYDKSTYKWDVGAERVHGLSRDYLKEYGKTEEDAVIEIAEFFLKHIGSVDEPITLLGHNVAVFDRLFLLKLLRRYDLPFKITHRCLDTFSLSMGTIQEEDSNSLFERMGYPVRESHNALDDAKMALKVYDDLFTVWNAVLDT